MRTLSLILLLLTACGDATESSELSAPVDCAGLDDVTCAEMVARCGECPTGFYLWAAFDGELLCVADMPCPCSAGDVCVDGLCESAVCR